VNPPIAMEKKKYQKLNSLVIYRRRMKFTQRTVARLLGHRDSTLLCAYERGRILPPLAAGLRLGLILRVPVEFLFPELYEELRKEIREKEEKTLLSSRSTLSNH
jgi:DNA-binding XRE family transcriptional regulator